MLHRVKRISFKGTKNTHGDALECLKDPGDLAIVQRGFPRTLVFRCPCGCGDVVTINLDRRVGKAWNLYCSDNSVTLYPSVWRDSGCESHFVLWSDRVLWVDDDWFFEEGDIEKLAGDILLCFPAKEYVHFYDIAEKADAIPWSVLRACRKLVSDRLLIEGCDKRRGYFMRVI